MKHIDQITEELRRNISKARMRHTLGTADTAAALAKKFDIDADQARLAALLHDCARDYSDEKLLEAARNYGIEVDFIHQCMPAMLHGPVGAVLAEQEYGIEDPEVLQAIKIHTLGAKTMQKLDKVLMIADFIEPGRRYPEAKYLREQLAAGINLDEAVLCCLELKIKNVLKSKWLLHPLAVECRNQLLLEMAANKEEN